MMGAAAVLATVERSGRVESVHRGAIAVLDRSGRSVAGAGEVDEPFYFRSSAKPIQLLVALEAGVAARYALGDRELAVAVSSHSGAPEQVEAVRDLLDRAGLGVEALACGYQEPRNRQSLARVLATGDRSPLYNNCSGKHAAMLALAAHLGADPRGYLEPDHPAQTRILDRTLALAGVARAGAHFGLDGCSAPTLHAPLARLAAAFARLAGEAGAAPIGAAMAARSDMLGEPESFNRVFAATLGGRLLAKGGAEGLFCVAVLGQGLGLAVRVEDGSSRALAPIVLELLVQLELVREEELGPLAAFRSPEIRNWRGVQVGSIQPHFTLARAVAGQRS